MADNSAPFEIIAAPFTLWLAPVGTAFPELAADPAADWVKVGTSGDLNYTEEGVKVQHSQSVEVWRALGSTGPRKAFRSNEDLKVSLTLADLSLEQYAIALNHNTVTEDAGQRSIGLSRGLIVAQRALLVRGVSPYEDGVAQFEVPVAVQTGSPEVVGRKNEPASLALEWTALEDPDATSDDERFGRLVAEDASVT